MEVVSVAEPVSKVRLKELAESGFGNLVKAVVDIEKEIMAIDAEMHSDQEERLLELGSEQSQLWGINFYPEIEGDDWIEFDSMINLRPADENRTRGVDDPARQRRIREVVGKLVV